MIPVEAVIPAEVVILAEAAIPVEAVRASKASPAALRPESPGSGPACRGHRTVGLLPSRGGAH